MTEVVPVAPVIGISISTELPGKRSLVFQTHVDQNMPKKDMDALVDKVQDVADRQFSRYLIEAIEAELEQHEKMAEDQVQRIAQVESNIQMKSSELAQNGRRNGYKPSPKEEIEKQQAHMNLEETRKRIALIRGKLQEHQAVVGS